MDLTWRHLDPMPMVLAERAEPPVGFRCVSMFPRVFNWKVSAQNSTRMIYVCCLHRWYGLFAGKWWWVIVPFHPSSKWIKDDQSEDQDQWWLTGIHRPVELHFVLWLKPPLEGIGPLFLRWVLGCFWARERRQEVSETIGRMLLEGTNTPSRQEQY